MHISFINSILVPYFNKSDFSFPWKKIVILDYYFWKEETLQNNHSGNRTPNTIN